MTPFDIAGLVGVATILAAYAATALGGLNPKGALALALNVVGPALILLSLTQKFNLSAVIVEAAWAMIALAGLIRIALGAMRRSAR